MTTAAPITVVLEQEQDFVFRIHFEGIDAPDVLSDEGAPLGHDHGPRPSHLLLAAIANCLSASLLFALRKYKNAPGRLRASISAAGERNAEGRVRLPRAQVTLQLPEGSADYQHLERVLATFEDFCTVTQSVRQGIDVQVEVRDAQGQLLLGQTPAEALL